MRGGDGQGWSHVYKIYLKYNKRKRNGEKTAVLSNKYLFHFKIRFFFLGIVQSMSFLFEQSHSFGYVFIFVAFSFYLILISSEIISSSWDWTIFRRFLPQKHCLDIRKRCYSLPEQTELIKRIEHACKILRGRNASLALIIISTQSPDVGNLNFYSFWIDHLNEWSWW